MNLTNKSNSNILTHILIIKIARLAIISIQGIVTIIMVILGATPHGNRLGHKSITSAQNSTPHGNSQSGSKPNGNNLILSGTAHANSMSNGTPMLADTTTTCSRTTETQKRGK